MTYGTLMVHMALGRPNATLLGVAASLAERFRSRVVGIAVCQPMAMAASGGYVSGELYQACQDELAKETTDAEAEFHAALDNRGHGVEWRTSDETLPLARVLAEQSRCADLLLTTAASAEFIDSSRAVGTGELVLHAGRPVLVVPAGAPPPTPRHALIAWRDTRESRRAVADALPLLKVASSVLVVEIAPAVAHDACRRQVDDVVNWLKHHGVKAESMVPEPVGTHAEQLRLLAQQNGIDLMVAGVYGHARVREWVFGGVTTDLLLHPEVCTLVSH